MKSWTLILNGALERRITNYERKQMTLEIFFGSVLAGCVGAAVVMGIAELLAPMKKIFTRLFCKHEWVETHYDGEANRECPKCGLYSLLCSNDMDGEWWHNFWWH